MGLKLELEQDALNHGNGSLIFKLKGNPLSTGLANFDFNFGGKSCSITLKVDSLKIGQTYKGGIIVYFFNENDSGYQTNRVNGIIASTNDFGTTLWGCMGTEIGSNYTNVGLGSLNLNKASSSNCSYAIKSCADLTLNGYDDWVLPTIDELGILYANKNLINLNYTSYWSSTEAGSENAYWFSTYIYQPYPPYYWTPYVQTFGPQASSKNNYLSIKPIRYF